DADDAHFGKAAEAEKEQAIAEDIQDVLSKGDQHGVAGVGMGAEGCGDGDVDGFEEQTSAHEGEERPRIETRTGGHLHPAEHGSREHGNPQADGGADPEVGGDGGGRDAISSSSVICTEVMGNDDAAADADESE